jgi:methionyl-tRNA formyltransferase
MTQKGFEILKAFIDNFDSKYIDCVVSSKDEMLVNDYYLEIENLCKVNNITFYDRKNAVENSSKYSFAISWRWIIKDVPNLIILHDSILPKYRGFSPLVSALINAETEIGVTAIYADSEFDRGDIISQKTTSINYPIKIKNAIDLISINYIDIIIELSIKIINDQNITSIKQDESKATYSLWRDEDDYIIDWTKDASQIKRFIDAVSEPYMGAKCFLNNEIVRIFDSQLEDDVMIENRVPGKVLFLRDGFPSVVCGKGLLRITKAIYETNKNNIIPLNKFRSRFY